VNHLWLDFVGEGSQVDDGRTLPVGGYVGSGKRGGDGVDDLLTAVFCVNVGEGGSVLGGNMFDLDIR
jgi:hypothetical protein